MLSESHALQITPQERDILLKHLSLPSGITARFRFALHHGGLLEVSLSESDMATVLDGLAEAMAETEDEEFILAVSDITQRNTGWDPEAALIDIQREMFPEDMPDALFEQIRGIVQDGDFTSAEEAFDAVQMLIAGHNDHPLDEFHGLSPKQLYGLLHTAWDATDTVLTLSADLTLDELQDSAMVKNAYRFLIAVAEEESIRLTARGNLNRKFLLKMTEATEWPRWDRASFLSYNSQPNEEDVMPVHALRIYLEIAGFIKLRKGKLTLTKAGREILNPARAGKLQAAMFAAMCGEFNLAYLDRLPDYPQVQYTYPVILYNLGRLAAQPAAIDELWRKVFLPPVYEDFFDGMEGRHAKSVLRSRVVHPLHDFGLLALTYRPSPDGRYEELATVQTTPLFHKMFCFSL